MVFSLKVAEHFQRRHKYILEVVRQVIADCPPNFTEPNFRPSEYTDPTGRKLPAYELTRDAFALVVMGFTGKEALAWKVRYIQAFNAMEAELRARVALPQGVPAPALPADMAALPKDRLIELLEAENAMLRRAPQRLRVTAEDTAAMLRMSASGLSPAEIGHRMGRKTETVRTALRRARLGGRP